jgi:hypothetical protein
MSNYLIHDNGGRPFLVQVDKEYIRVYKKKSESSRKYNELIMGIEKYDHVFIGRDEKTGNEGHSILVKCDPYNYVRIGDSIYQFTTSDEIKEYVAPIGNSDVVYDWAVGTNNVYLLLEKTYFNKEFYDPYVMYYKHTVPFKKIETTVINERIF